MKALYMAKRSSSPLCDEDSQSNKSATRETSGDKPKSGTQDIVHTHGEEEFFGPSNI